MVRCSLLLLLSTLLLPLSGWADPIYLFPFEQRVIHLVEQQFQPTASPSSLRLSFERGTPIVLWARAAPSIGEEGLSTAFEPLHHFQPECKPSLQVMLYRAVHDPDSPGGSLGSLRAARCTRTPFDHELLQAQRAGALSAEPRLRQQSVPAWLESYLVLDRLALPDGTELHLFPVLEQDGDELAVWQTAVVLPSGLGEVVVVQQLAVPCEADCAEQHDHLVTIAERLANDRQP